VGNSANSSTRHPAVVVGAGPVGLSSALALRSLGLPVTVLEAEPADRGRPGSRAIYVHGTTLRLLESIHPGLGWQMAEGGISWRTKRTYVRGREVFARTYPPPRTAALPPFTSIPQVQTESILLDACKSADVELVWDARVETVKVTADGVTLATSSGDEWRADYVVGADGARSAVRGAVGITMEGSRSVNHYVIVDVAEDPGDPMPVERVFHYEHPAVGRRNVLLAPFAGGWRADLQCREDDDPEQFASPDGVKRWIAATIGERYADRVTWVSTYQFLQVLASSYTDQLRRVLLVGEAAHLFAPFGARGMNSGIVDGEAAATAIHRALTADDDRAARRAVEDFAVTRREAGAYNRDAAAQALDHLRASGPAARLKRRLAAEIARVYTPAGEWLDRAPYGPTGAPPSGSPTRY
jgi:3-(3-hydroxy-phenyl)propionate hydroxylase